MNRLPCDKCKIKPEGDLSGREVETDMSYGEDQSTLYLCEDCIAKLEPTGKQPFKGWLEYPCQTCGVEDGNQDNFGYFVCGKCKVKIRTPEKTKAAFEKVKATYGKPFRWKQEA